ncbi:MAG: hypothetical protein II235_04220 [Muribaculaceae bacterium]|nr:hypothetical protein [Muribaculaceae bacterium]
MKENFFLESELAEMEALEIKGGADYEINAQKSCTNSAWGCGAGTDQEGCTNTVTGCGSDIEEPPILQLSCVAI